MLVIEVNVLREINHGNLVKNLFVGIVWVLFCKSLSQESMIHNLN